MASLYRLSLIFPSGDESSQRPKKWQKVKHKNEVKNASMPKSGLKQGKCPKWDPKRPTKQRIPKIRRHRKWATPKMIQNGRKAIHTCNLPHSEAVKANGQKA
jgi:hypothetical protein